MQESSIKKYWLLLVIIHPFFTLFEWFSANLFVSKMDIMVLQKDVASSYLKYFFISLFLLRGIMSVVYYYSAYVRNGVKLLNLTIYANSIISIFLIIWVINAQMMKIEGQDLVTTSLAITSLIVSLVWIFLCLKLKHRNQKAQLKKIIKEVLAQISLNRHEE